MSGLPAIVSAIADTPELSERIALYNRNVARLHDLEDAVESDRFENSHRQGGWFSAPPPPIHTERRELRILDLTRELEQELASIKALCKIWHRLGPNQPA